MAVWLPRDRPENHSNIAMSDVDGMRRSYPEIIETANDYVRSIEMIAPGIIKVEPHFASNEYLVLSGGVHGDEKAGVVILDRLLYDIIIGDLPVQGKNILFLYGNLEAMQVNDGHGARCVQPEVGVNSNLNRCFNRGRFEKTRCYAERRANEMMDAIAGLGNANIEAIDIHQSFDVPTLEQLRGDEDRTEYTYAMLYPKTEQSSLAWIYMCYSDIVAGAVLNDMDQTHHTWAGYLATQHGANAATFEQGTIGRVDHLTFSPQLLDNLRRHIRGEVRAMYRQGCDVWRCVRSIARNTKDFMFLDSRGNPLTKAPSDFMSLGYSVVARDGDITHQLTSEERLLFANATVPLGDRAAQVIVEEKEAMDFSPGEVALRGQQAY